MSDFVVSIQKYMLLNIDPQQHGKREYQAPSLCVNILKQFQLHPKPTLSNFQPCFFFGWLVGTKGIHHLIDVGNLFAQPPYHLDTSFAPGDLGQIKNMLSNKV